jgi:hypothetical protein
MAVGVEALRLRLYNVRVQTQLVRTCRSCGREKPLNAQNFRPHTHGFTWRCRECIAAAENVRYHSKKSVARQYTRLSNLPPHRRCRTCGQSKVLNRPVAESGPAIATNVCSAPGRAKLNGASAYLKSSMMICSTLKAVDAPSVAGRMLASGLDISFPSIIATRPGGADFFAAGAISPSAIFEMMPT